MELLLEEQRLLLHVKSSKAVTARRTNQGLPERREIALSISSARDVRACVRSVPADQGGEETRADSLVTGRVKRWLLRTSEHVT